MAPPEGRGRFLSGPLSSEGPDGVRTYVLLRGVCHESDLPGRCSAPAGPGHERLPEPARLGCPVASGPYVDNWASAYQALDTAEGVVRVSEAQGLDTVLRQAAAGDAALADMAGRARALVDRRDAEARGVAGRILALLP